jgi:Uma2 family endonuclease
MRLGFVRESDIDHEGDAVTTAIFSDERPMTDAEFLAIDDSPDRIELFDGSLYMSPGSTPRHQRIASELLVALRGPARRAGLDVHFGPNVRLLPRRVLIPDLVLAIDVDYDDPVIDASAVVLACEVTSPSNASVDRILKKHFYAEAGIPWYLLVEHRTATLHLYELADGKFVEHSVTEVGDVLHLAEPVVVSIDPAELLPPR